MRRRMSSLALAALAVGLLGKSCTGQGDITIVAPLADETILSPGFGIEVRLAPDTFDPSSFQATLNGVAIPMAGGPEVFTLALGPGAPLRDQNLLSVRATTPSGVSFEERRAFAWLPPKARARRIADAADLVIGPLGHSRIGDYLLENDEVRYVVQDAPKRDLYAVGQFGGNLIDAELRSRPGLDNFLELQPGLNIETVLHALSIEIVNDGEDGTPAIVRSCGPDDTLDFINPSTNVEEAGFSLPESVDDADHPVEACTEYVLAPGGRALELTTTVFNGSPEALGLYVGDFINASGEVEPWMNSGGGLGEILTGTSSALSFIGFGEASRVDYAFVPLPIPGSPVPRSDFLTVSGTTVTLQSHSILAALFFGVEPLFVMPGAGSNSFTRYFAVGEGGGSHAVDLQLALSGTASGRLEGCVTVGGVPAPGARVAVGPRNAQGRLQSVTSHFVTDEDGCYRGRLRVGSFGVAAAREGTPYEGGGSVPMVHAVDIVAGGTAVRNLALPATGRLRVAVTDAAGAPLPARVGVIGFDPSPEPLILVPGTAGTPSSNTGWFHDSVGDGVPFGLAALAYAGADGIVEIDIEPGSYQVAVSRGSEYSLHSEPVSIVAGATATLAAKLVQVVDSTGFVSSDYHVHGIASADSRVSQRNRALQFAGEGVDNVIMTDHHAHTDLNPKIAALGLTPFLHATVGEEITSWDYGHFNGYPLLVDPTRQSNGSTDWARAAPPGQDFKSLGAFSMTPAELYAEATTGALSTPDTVVQVNHIGSHFGALEIDTALVPPQSFLSPEEKLRFRLDPGSGNLFFHFPALELWNGAGRSAQNTFRNERIGVWFNLLNQGLRSTAIADTDTHSFRNLETAGARTWTAASSDAPAAIDDGELARAVRAGRAVGGQGIYVQARLFAADGSGAVADLRHSGQTLVSSSNGNVELEIHVQSPLWARYDRIEIYANAATTVSGSQGGVPVAYGAVPSLVHLAGTHFTLSQVSVDASVPGAARFETSYRVPFSGLEQDTWFVVLVRGSDGVSPPMFPVMTHDLARGSNTTLANLLDGNLGESGVLALGHTNALFADVDGVPGFQAPLAPGSAPAL